MSLFAGSRHVSLIAAVLAATLGSPLPLLARIVATDGDVPIGIEAGGSAADPAVYVIGDTGPFHVNTPSNTYWVGTGSAYNHLIVQNGSSVVKDNVNVGFLATATHNHVHITGGSQVTLTNRFWMGYRGTHNSVVISGVGTSVSVNHDITVGDGGGNNTFTLEGGAFLESGLQSSASDSIIGANSSNNAMVVTGSGTRWSNHAGLFISPEGSNNTLTVQDEALVSADSLYFGSTQGNAVFLDGGFLALKGDLNQSVLELWINWGFLNYWDPIGEDWVVGTTNDFLYGYFANEADAFDFTGYSGLAGYTIVTTFPVSPIPEPSTYAALAGAAVLGLAVIRRRRR